MTDSKYSGQRHLIAVGAEHAVGHFHSAYIAAPPESVTAPLFRATDSPKGEGMGFYKLEFYSPENFRMFWQVLQIGNTDAYESCGGMPDPPGNSE